MLKNRINQLKMKKITITFLCLSFFVCFAHSQTIFACQFTGANGFTYEGGRWKTQQFILDKPFFIKINSNGIINDSSLKGVGMDYLVQCMKAYSNSRPELIRCNDPTDTLIFNTKTLEGAKSALGGASQAPTNNPRDDLSIRLFNCQSM